MTISASTIMKSAPTGMSAFLYQAQNKNNIVFFIQFIRNQIMQNGIEPQSVSVPIVYDINLNTMNIPLKEQNLNLGIISMINRVLQDASQRPDFSIYSAIRDVMCSDLIM